MQDWLQISRNQAEERFRSLPFPTAKDENYRFTPLAYKESATAAASGFAWPESIANLGEGEAALLLLAGENAEFKGSVKAVIFCDLLQATTTGLGSVSARLQGADLFRDDKFAQLTAARWQNGAFIHVPAGVRHTQPLRFVSALESQEEHSRHLIVLEEGAEAVVIQENYSDESPHFLGELIDVKLGKNAKLHWIHLQHLGSKTEAVVRQRVELQEGAELRYSPLQLGGSLMQSRQEVHLAGDSSFFEMQGAARGDQQQHFDFWLDIRHESPRSRSEMNYWFVMAGKSRGVFNGQVDVKKNVPDCESSQKSKTLLLGSGAVHTMPKLIIQTDAVKCSHGASVSSVNFEQLHYLQSRGISRVEAERMIVRGFTEVVVERFPDSLRERAEALLDTKQGGKYD